MSVDSYSLRELEAVFMKRIDDTHRQEVDAIAAADGLMFMCPKCYEANGGPVGTHQVMCWFEGKVPDTEVPGPGRWTPAPPDATIDNLSFVPSATKSCSVMLTGGCQWHGMVTNGRATLK